MQCGDTCRHNISKLNSGLSVKLLQRPLQGPGKALGDNLEGACSIFLQKNFVLVCHIYWIFRLLRGGWLGCTRAFVKWHLLPYAFKFTLWSTATDAFPWGAWPRDAAVTRTGKQAGKALRSQGQSVSGSLPL